MCSDARVWKILRLAFRWGKSANPTSREEMRRSGHVNESDVIVDEVRLPTKDLKVSPTYDGARRTLASCCTRTTQVDHPPRGAG
jgi:hypothetical protein